MKIKEIGPNVRLVSRCPRPIWDRDVCDKLTNAGVNSLLVVDEDLTPWPSGQGSLWCYVRPFADATHPSACELQRITDFVRYETSQKRTVGVWIGYVGLEELIVRLALAESPTPQKRKSSDDPCCCRPYHAGCRGNLVCHATPVELAAQVLQSGKLLSKPASTGKSLSEIVREMREWGQSDPPDYFDFVCLANGDCVAPDKVAMERHAGTWLNASQCDERFYPGIHFFFDPHKLANHPQATWDGIQAIKVRNDLDLTSYLTAAVASEVDRNGAPLHFEASSTLQARTLKLDHREHYGLSAWSIAAFNAAATFMGGKERGSGA